MPTPLTDYEASIIIHKGTEHPFTGQYRDHHEQGLYCCRQCGAPFYRSTTKFDSRCGWPSFDDAIPGKVLMTPDSDGMRTEITCRTCDGHLGHVFVGEQFTQTNTRHCVNSISLVFVDENNITDTVRAQIPVYERIVLGGGCFRCIEGALSRVPGVIECRSGYMGGKRPYPRYEQVCAGASGHIEVVQVYRDPQMVSLGELLAYFFLIHDPTSMDRQGNDVGSQYRSAIFYETQEQETIITDWISHKQSEYERPIVTQVRQAETFWLAEGYHQNFYATNPTKPYCQLVVKPKVEKVEEKTQSTS